MRKRFKLLLNLLNKPKLLRYSPHTALLAKFVYRMT